jgi:hypothetical protein
LDVTSLIEPGGEAAEGPVVAAGIVLLLLFLLLFLLLQLLLLGGLPLGVSSSKVRVRVSFSPLRSTVRVMVSPAL